MKTKELIRQLQEADPTGDAECCIGNADILSVYEEPAYYDGCLQVLIRDVAKLPYYDVVGAKYVASGQKITIYSHSISDAIFNNVNLPVTYEGLSENSQKNYELRVANRKKETEEINQGVECELFEEYMLKRLKDNEEFDRSEIKKAAKQYYNENISYNDPIPQDILDIRIPNEDGKYNITPSWFDRKSKQWDREIAVDLKDGKLELKKHVSS